jgi:hypothetical protein
MCSPCYAGFICWKKSLRLREAKKGFGDNVLKWVWAIAQRIPLIHEKYRFRAECAAFYD